MKTVLQFSLLTLGLACVSPCDASLVATYNGATDVPVTSVSYSATGTFSATLNFAPATGTNLMVVRNTGLNFINGKFTNLAQGQLVTLSHGGIGYRFVANYYGGSGNDLVLQWANTRVVGWGSNFFGQIGDGGFTNWPVPASVYTAGVLATKTVVSAASGQYHTLALCSDGTIAGWGTNRTGQLGSDGPGLEVFVRFPVAVSTSGALAGKTVVCVAASRDRSAALCSDGTIATWGVQNFVPLAMSNTGALAGKAVVSITGGGAHFLALCSDGTVAAWGANDSGQLGNDSTVSNDVPVAVNIAGVLSGKTVVAVAAGAGHSLAVCSDGTLAAWGYNANGQLGNGSTATSLVPVAVDTTGVLAGKTATAVAAGASHSMVLCSDGTVAAWGQNSSGQLGNGSTIESTVPVAVNSAGVLAGKTVVGVSAGVFHSAARTSDGKAMVWGNNTYGQFGNNSSMSTLVSTVPVEASAPPLNGESFAAVFGGSYANHVIGLASAPIGPMVYTQVPSGTNSEHATLRGIVNTAAASATASFEYGLDTAYGSTIDATQTPGSIDTLVTAALTGLTPETTYHYRVRLTTASGTYYGGDIEFTTRPDTSGPTGGTMTVSPDTEVGLGAPLEVNFGGWADFSSPITFELLINGIVVSEKGTASTRNLIGPTVTGLHTFTGRIYDTLGNITETTRYVSVSATQAEWRTFHFGTADNAGDAADSADPDGDGATNFFEYVAGLTPTDPSSRFKVRVEHVPGQPGQKAIVFSPRLAGRTYAVRYKASLSDATWTPLTNMTVSNSGDERRVTDLSAVSATRYYQVEIKKP